MENLLSPKPVRGQQKGLPDRAGERKDYPGPLSSPFCAHPYVWRLLGIPDDTLDIYQDCGASGTPGMIRVSFGIYNTEEEVDEFLRVLSEAIPAAKAYVEELTEDQGELTQAFDPAF